MKKTQPHNDAKIQIDQIIRENGFISIFDFFQISNRFYYNSLNSIGKKGDFITSPEISQLFGETIALSIYNKWQNLGSNNVKLVELGPGNGTLMSDILRTLEKLPDISTKIESVILIETSQSLKEKQKDKLHNSKFNIIWHKHLKEVSGNNCIIVCNEFFDALPFTQYKFIDSKINEVVIAKNYEFDFIESNFSNTLNLKNNDIVEYSEPSIEYAQLINKKTINGAGIIIDYGYWESPKISTLQAMKKNKKIDIFDFIGESDLTFYVNFQDLAYCFGNRTLNFSTQGEFLSINGIQALASSLLKKEPSLINKINEDIIRLTSQDQMGSLFKVLEIT